MKITELFIYPPPEENPDCQCAPVGLATYLCPTGHMTECHYPKSCQEAQCSRLARYDPEWAQLPMRRAPRT